MADERSTKHELNIPLCSSIGGGRIDKPMCQLPNLMAYLPRMLYMIGYQL